MHTTYSYVLSEYSFGRLHMPHGALWKTKMYGPLAYKPPHGSEAAQETQAEEKEPTIDPLLAESYWPEPTSAQQTARGKKGTTCFDWLNRFVERANDILELLDCSRQFNAMRVAAQVGASGHDEVDAQIRAVAADYSAAMQTLICELRGVPHLSYNVLLLDEQLALMMNVELAAAPTNSFENLFFQFRTRIRVSLSSPLLIHHVPVLVTCTVHCNCNLY